MAFGGGNPLVAILLAQRMVSRTKAEGSLRWIDGKLVSRLLE